MRRLADREERPRLIDRSLTPVHERMSGRAWIHRAPCAAFTIAARALPSRPHPTEPGVAPPEPHLGILLLHLGEVVIGEKAGRGNRGRVAGTLQHGVDGATGSHE
jgi:hypothetical protein